MARATTPTKLSIDRFGAIFGLHPLHLNQVTLPTMPPSVCAQPWIQHPWQSADRVGREDLSLAIRQAEDDIERELQTRLAPSWEVDEWREGARMFRPELSNMGNTDIRGFGQNVSARWKHFISGGIEAKTLVGNAAISYSDADGDTIYDELATVTIAVSFTDPCEVEVYYPGKAGDASWQIRPIEVSIAGGLATITFRRELAVLEEFLEAFEPNDVDGTQAANFLTNVDVYRHYNDPQRQVQFLWEPFATGCNTCGGSGCPTCGYSTQEGCLMVRGDPRLSRVVYHPATWNEDTLDFDATNWAFAREPAIVRLWYLAGLRDKSLTCGNARMPLEWERAVAYYAASLLDRPVCECNNVGAYIKYWRRDLAIGGEGEEEAASVDPDLIGNPFGSKRGAVFAWQQVKRSRELPQEIAI